MEKLRVSILVVCCTLTLPYLPSPYITFPKNPDLRKLWLSAIGRNNFVPSSTALICEKHFTKEDYELNVHRNRVLKKGAVPTCFNVLSDSTKDSNTTNKERAQLGQSIEEYDAGMDCTIYLEIEQKSLETLSNSVTNIESLDLKTQLQNLDELSNSAANLDGLSNISIKTETLPLKMHENIDKPFNSPNSIESVALESIQMAEDIKPSVSETQTKPAFVRNRRDPIYFGDFKEEDLEYPDKRKRFYKVANESVRKYKKLNKYYQCRIRRLEQKIEKLKSLIGI